VVRRFAHQGFDRDAHRAREFAQQQHGNVALTGLELREVALRDAGSGRERLARHAVAATPGAYPVAELGEVGGFLLGIELRGRGGRGVHEL
jgi:hypothetical protein